MAEPEIVGGNVAPVGSREAERTSHHRLRLDRAVPIVLSIVAGHVDVISYLGLFHTFVAQAEIGAAFRRGAAGKSDQFHLRGAELPGGHTGRCGRFYRLRPRHDAVSGNPAAGVQRGGARNAGAARPKNMECMMVMGSPDDRWLAAVEYGTIAGPTNSRTGFNWHVPRAYHFVDGVDDNDLRRHGF